MIEKVQVTDHHFVALLSDKEHHDLKVRVAESGMIQKEWIRMAITEKLNRQEG